MSERKLFGCVGSEGVARGIVTRMGRDAGVLRRLGRAVAFPLMARSIVIDRAIEPGSFAVGGRTRPNEVLCVLVSQRVGDLSCDADSAAGTVSAPRSGEQSQNVIMARAIPTMASRRIGPKYRLSKLSFDGDNTNISPDFRCRQPCQTGIALWAASRYAASARN